MPEFVLPDEADHCVYCGKVLTDPPSCCDKAMEEWDKEFFAQYIDK
jgi:hypothetical protein